jgi:hypothetical protein
MFNFFQNKTTREDELMRHPAFIETQKQMEEAANETPSVRIAKLILAVAMHDKATMVVIGEPPDDGCARIRRPILEGDAIGAKHPEAEVPQDNPFPYPVCPVWYRKGHEYVGGVPIPASALDYVLNVMKTWHGCEVPADYGKPVQTGFHRQPEGIVSEFQFLHDGQRVKVVLKREPHWHFLLSPL